MKKSYKIEVECANCAGKMETALNKLAEVKEARVNFLLQKLTIEFAEGCDPKAVMHEAQRVCRRIESDCTIEL